MHCYLPGVKVKAATDHKVVSTSPSKGSSRRAEEARMAKELYNREQKATRKAVTAIVKK
ncbi:hypothetical protein [Candidatus Cardinium hertigii]|uniref:Uncharacterized protein n=1 Tax=Candidatus Cardinium hertigii TaxID=247481 RepID=A0A2Z3LA55_9BACT|nr:hypothetical protein [Candidatus Cardinium hertigii]AWN82207.1 hypothetical protein DK880_00909 [Candidatus Cardinium hertigii]